MAISPRLASYLKKKRIHFRIRELAPFSSLLQAADAARLPPGKLVKTVAVKDSLGLVLVVTLGDRQLELDALSKLLHRRMELAAEEEIKRVFPDCEPRCVPPFGEAYGVRTIVDEDVLAAESLHLTAGDNVHLIQLDDQDFFSLLSGAWLASHFTRNISGYAVDRQTRSVTEMPGSLGGHADIRRRIESLSELPAMPAMAQKILGLRADPNADVSRLAELVEQDPSLAAQVIRYARSPFFAYGGKVDSVHTAIARVLGFEMVMNLALGIAAARPFRIPSIGPLGLNNFWRHATYSAALVQALAKSLPLAQHAPPGLSYLAGLLHNFGHLLLGHLFKREFCMLNNLITDHPELPLEELEQRALGVTHPELGAWLMARWNMPEEIIVATRHHHDESYAGPHAIYPRLVMIADHVLKGHGIGDAPQAELPDAVLEALGAEELQILMAVRRILDGCEGLNAMARQLAA
ncbi:MAG TPA: HDOD domain-containing protein [Gammaproteobacteria bacterium]|nr:HDOD domain-containing protein [Gammaproteobacteria bacterium]